LKMKLLLHQDWQRQLIRPPYRAPAEQTQPQKDQSCI